VCQDALELTVTRGLLEKGDAVVLPERISVSGQKRGMQESPDFQGEWDGQEGTDEEDLLVLLDELDLLVSPEQPEIVDSVV